LDVILRWRQLTMWYVWYTCLVLGALAMLGLAVRHRSCACKQGRRNSHQTMLVLCEWEL
jgi:hypothetical protein